MWRREATCTPRSTEENVGCMQGIFNMFYVYPGSGTRKLLSDGPRRSKWYLKKKNKPKLLPSVDDKHKGSNCESAHAKLGAANASALKKGKANKRITDAQSQSLTPNLASASHSDKGTKKRNKSFGVCRQKANNDLSIGSNFEPNQSRRVQQYEEFSNDIHVDALLEGLYNNTHKDHCLHTNSKNRIHSQRSEDIITSETFDCLDRHDLQLHQDDPVLEKTLDEVLESIIHNKVVNPNQPTTAGATDQSEELKNVLETLRSSKDLLLEVLQDPKIVNILLGKHVDSQQNSTATMNQNVAESGHFDSEMDTKKSEHISGHCILQNPMISSNSVEEEPKDSRPSKETENTQRQNITVLLNPNQTKDQDFLDTNEPRSPSHSLYSSSPNRENEVISFRFVAQEIKRKLKQVFGISQRQRHMLSTEEVRDSSPSDSQALDGFSDTSEYLKADDMLGSSGVEQEVLLPSESKTKSGEFQLCTEAKLSSRVDDDDCLDTPTYTSLEDIIYIPDYVIAPGSDVIKDKVLILPPQQMTYSSPMQSPTRETDLKQTVQSRMQSEILIHDANSSVVELQMFYPTSESTKIHTGEVVITGETTIPEDFIVTTIEGDEPDAKSISKNVIENPGSAGSVNVPLKYEKDGSQPSLDLFEGSSQLESPAVPSATATLVNQKIVASDGTRKSVIPSAAVLRESLILDKVIKPGSRKAVHDQFRISPQKRRFHKHNDSVYNFTISNQETNSQLCVGDDDFKFEYMRALLEPSNFCLSIAEKSDKHSTKLLDPSLYDEVETPSGEIPDDLKLFFDCLDEVLEEIYESSSSSMPLLSFIDPSLRPFPSGEKLLQEAWRVLNIHFVPWLPGTLDKTLKKDLENQTWMDIRCSIQEIGVTLGDDILDKILDETVLELWG